MKANQATTAVRAYQLWQERGGPGGSPDLDWFEAERQLAAMAPSSRESQGIPTTSEGQQRPVQGEGDYEAAERYREEITEFVKTSDIEKLAKQAAPHSAKDVRDLNMAERAGKAHSKGDDPTDVKIMYTGAQPKQQSDT